MPRLRTRALTAKLNQFKNAVLSLLSDFRPVWKEQTPIIQDEMAKTLLRGNYEPITKATRQWRIRRGYSPSNPPLEASRSLLRSLQGGNGAIVKEQRKTLEVGTSLPQAAPNQFGAEIRVRKKSDKQKASGKGRPQKEILYRFRIPPRPFVPDPEAESFVTRISRQMESFMARYLVQKLNSDKPKE